MPSSHDQPTSSSQLLVSRHDPSCRLSTGGASEGVNEEADEPPNHTTTPGPAQPPVISDAEESSGNEGDEDASDHEDCKEEEDDAARLHNASSPPALPLTSPLLKVGRTRSSPAVASSARIVDRSVDCTDTSSGAEDSDSGSSSPSPSVASSTSPVPPPLYLSPLPLSVPPTTGYALPPDYDPSHPSTRLPPAGHSVSYVSPLLEARTSHTGSGIFALQPIAPSAVLIVWTGRILTAEQTLPLMSTPDKHYILQIGDGFYQTPLQAYREPADWTNHSCHPNAGFGAQSPVCLVAMRAIGVGEEVTFDYGMCETDERLWEPMECMCGSAQCRGWITANDWRDQPQLWERYQGFFSPHVQRKIDAHRKVLNERERKDEEGREAGKGDGVCDGKVTVKGGWLDRALYAMGVVRTSQLQQRGLSVRVG